jgi:hypothetical protein
MHIRIFRVVKRLSGNKQRVANKKHDNPHDEGTRRSREKPQEESAQSRFPDGIEVPCLFLGCNSVAHHGRLDSHSPSAFALR